MRMQGKILNWHDDKGFGFVDPLTGGQRAFVHIKSFISRARRPVNGDVIHYELVQESHHRYKAECIQFADDVQTAKPQRYLSNNHHAQKTHSKRTLEALLTGLFCAFILIFSLIGSLPLILAGAFIVMSTVTFVAYGIDKSAAESGRWRTKESTLHVFAFLCGWPGAFVAQRLLRHKSSKHEFQSFYKVTVALNVAGIVFLFTETGRTFLNQIVLPWLANA
ncbi:DUF1294 domain-containing protein [Oceanisphaera pacifica]|uniref:Cold shock and DUF1294 domain-containing protein n=1 Tax=Oceanisphaera pacifica TaxID=2818389 RepID=A0ABS3NFP6_9GAMM|nr:cold shock and DUF1294 domain-containing protein [Oceanisphaera pacifica]MBO1519404.1 cold shock and DUF1294 domain-containing protein [Oceanisphaera pacifica]